MKKRKKKSNKQSRREIIADVKRREVEGNIYIFLLITYIRHAVRYT